VLHLHNGFASAHFVGFHAEVRQPLAEDSTLNDIEDDLLQ